MKEASGELSMTLIVIIAVGAILALFTTFMFPQIKETISKKWGEWNHSAETSGDLVDDGSGQVGWIIPDNILNK